MNTESVVAPELDRFRELLRILAAGVVSSATPGLVVAGDAQSIR